VAGADVCFERKILLIGGRKENYFLFFFKKMEFGRKKRWALLGVGAKRCAS
jgi:hypothetical protein